MTTVRDFAAGLARASENANNRVSSKQSNFVLGLNQNKPKLNLFQSVLVVFRFVSRNQEHFFRFVSVFQTGIKATETNRTLLKQTELCRNKPEQTETNRNKPKQTEKISNKRFLLGGPRNSWFFFSV
jgi:hypothetical protein